MPPHPPEDDYHPAPGGLAAKASALARGTRYLDVLNPEQRAAVETLEGPVLVLAGAGTGKTRVLTTRIAHILSLGLARAWEILAVTFTNKASREMRERVETLVGQGAEAMQWLGTFHAISAKILRRHAELVGLKSNFTILDTDDQIRLLKQVLKAENIDDKRWPARALAHRIDGWKNRGLTPAQVPAGEAHDFADGKGAALYALYQERLKILNAVDFGDLLLEALRLFRDNPDVLADYQRRFKYILVDEYQDTNTAQYLWLRLIAQGRRNVCCVGDDDQSVYGWRGAEVENILRFEKDFPGAKTVRLERNYRSTGHILAAASHLIAHNEGRLGKTLRTEDVDLGYIVLNAVNDAAVAAPDHQWVKDLPDEPVWVRGDPDRLHQLVSNLLATGWVHTPPGVTVTTGIVCHRSESDASFAELTVADDGPDIDPELLPHLFDRFVRAKHAPHDGSGNGLGLAIVDSIVKAHHGSVTAESADGQTIFRVRLPLV